MAVIEVKVPQLSESVSEATLLHWRKQIGEAVQRDENLVDIETDKVVLELPAVGAGVITKILRGDGEKVVAGEVIALIDSEAIATVVPAEPVAAAKKASELNAVEAVPAAARMLAANNLSADQVVGTGKGGKITKQDVMNAIERKTQPVPPAQLATPLLQSVQIPLNSDIGDRPEDRVPMSRLRARIAERLVQSQMTTATLTTFNEVNMQPVMDLRNRYKEKFEEEHGVWLGFSSFFV